MDCSIPAFPVLDHLPELLQTHVRWVSDAIQSSHLLSPLSPLALNLSQPQGLFQWVNSSHQVAKCWSFSFSISPSSEYSGLISFRIDWFDLLDVQGTLKSLLQHNSLKASIMWKVLKYGYIEFMFLYSIVSWNTSVQIQDISENPMAMMILILNINMTSYVGI